jgi:hypothetical protein
MELENIILNEVTETQKDMHCYVLTKKWILAKKKKKKKEKEKEKNKKKRKRKRKKWEIPKIQSTELKKINKLNAKVRTLQSHLEKKAITSRE